MSLVRSKKRVSEPVQFTIKDDMVLTATGAVNIHVPFIVNHVDFFPSSFKLEAGGKCIFLDPVIIEGEEKADYILLTHGHEDHFSIPDIKKLVKKETVVVCPSKVCKKLTKHIQDCIIQKIEPGEHLDDDSFRIQAIGAYNVKAKVIAPHAKSAGNVGYIITKDHVSVYHAGDTDYTPEMSQLKNITVALTPIDGGKLTMTTEEAGAFINHIKPKYTIPMHYNLGTDQLEVFKKLVTENTNLIIMDRHPS